jgi:hypothetical protein
MQSLAATPTAPRSRLAQSIDVQAVSLWALAATIVVYLALNGGGYDVIIRNQIGIAVWWGVLVCAALGVLPRAPLTRRAYAALLLFGGFVAWTALATTWSHSTERSLDELSRVACYLGVLVLAIGIHRDRERAMRHTITAVASAIVAVAALALLSRLRPGTFAGAEQTATFLPGTQGRLAWPLNYWNALAALMAIGVPLLLATASSARTLAGQAAAAGAVPVVALCGYLTFSRGGALAAAGGLIAYFAFTGDRIPKLLTALVTAAGSAVLVVAATHRHAVENGLTNATAQHQGRQLLVAIVLVVVATALLQAAIGLAVRHGTRPRWLQISREQARTRLVVGLIAVVVLGFAASAPSRLSHAWHNFKRPTAVGLSQDALARFGTASGNGRYDYWRVSVHETPIHLLTGWGPGTWQFVWLPHANYWSYVRNAHSLYLETLVEVGVIGLALLVGFFLLAIGSAVRLAIRSRYEMRARAAGIAASCVAFAISAGVDWTWQVPVLPVVFLLLVGAVLAPRRRRSEAAPAPGSGRSWNQILVRAAFVAFAVGALVALVIPLASTNALRDSQAAAAGGQQAVSLADAHVAAQIEPGAASPQLQSALVYELEGNYGAAVAVIQRATADEPLNWDLWLVRSRLEAEDGQSQAAVQAFVQARSLNPYSPVFRSLPRHLRALGLAGILTAQNRKQPVRHR